MSNSWLKELAVGHSGWSVSQSLTRPLFVMTRNQSAYWMGVTFAIRGAGSCTFALELFIVASSAFWLKVSWPASLTQISVILKHPDTLHPMELEGQWWKGQLAGDIYHALRYKVYLLSSNFCSLILLSATVDGNHECPCLSFFKELRLPVYKGQSPQLNLRRYFADLIAIVSNRFRLCPAARHLAVYLLDLFMDRYDISVQQLHMVALSCILLASKLPAL